MCTSYGKIVWLIQNLKTLAHGKDWQASYVWPVVGCSVRETFDFSILWYTGLLWRHALVRKQVRLWQARRCRLGPICNFNQNWSPELGRLSWFTLDLHLGKVHDRVKGLKFGIFRKRCSPQWSNFTSKHCSSYFLNFESSCLLSLIVTSFSNRAEIVYSDSSIVAINIHLVFNNELKSFQLFSSGTREKKKT